MAHPDADPDADPAAGVARPRLLHADEDRLRLVAATLARGGRFVLVVADAALWPAALELLRERLPDHTFVERAPASSEEANQAISDSLRDAPGTTIVIRITGRDAGPIETLNLRRESLVKAAANFLVVLEGDEAHNRFLREAPDCYSYRHLLAVLEGEPSLTTPARFKLLRDNFLRMLAEAREASSPYERADRLQGLAQILLWNNEPLRTRELIDEAISAIASDDEQGLDEDRRLLLARLYRDSSLVRSRTERYRLIRKASELLRPIADSRPTEFLEIEGLLPDAIGVDPSMVEEALSWARRGESRWLVPYLARLALAYCARDHLVRARKVLAELDAIPVARNMVDRLFLNIYILIREGSWVEADRLVATSNQWILWQADRERLDQLRARLLTWRGEHRAAERVCETLPPSNEKQLLLAKLKAESGQTRDARIEIEQMIDSPRTEGGPSIEHLLDMHDVLAYVSDLEAAADVSLSTREALDSRLASLRQHIERTEDPAPPWDLIRCLLLQVDVYLKRSGAERLALQHAEEAWKLADERASVLASGVTRRLVVASLRLGEFDQAQEWLARGLARAREHEHRGDEAQLRGLALWHDVIAGGDVGRAESEMRASVAATGSVTVEASVLAHVGAALDRRDLLQRAQQIYRSLPWPSREGACLEALGELRIAEVRYRTFGLAARLAILGRRAGPPPTTAVDDDWPSPPLL